MPNSAYKFDSNHKSLIRERWVVYIKETIEDPDKGATIITFPSNEMQELFLYEKEGIIQWEMTETQDFRITKGEVISFEKDHTKWRELKTKLPFSTVEKEFGTYLVSNAKSINKEKIKIFPVDAVNLDYEKNISKNEIPLDVIFELIFQFQAKYKKNISLFITWPEPHDENDDDPEFINSLKNLITDNLEDLNAINFKKKFEEESLEIEKLSYERLSITGITKKLLKKATQQRFQLEKTESYFYGEEGRKKMMSVLYKFNYVGVLKSSSKIYSEDVSKSLDSIKYLVN